MTRSDARKRTAARDAAQAEVGAEALDEVERVLREHGLTDEPATYDSDIHSWRCSYPAVYGPCSCFQDLAVDLLAALDGPGKPEAGGL